MRVLVLWEDEREQEDAVNLANILVGLAPSLAVDGVAESGGGVTMRYRESSHRPRPKVLVRVASYASQFDQWMVSILGINQPRVTKDDIDKTCAICRTDPHTGAPLCPGCKYGAA